MSFPYTVIRDTREKKNHGWTWNARKGVCAGTVERKLDTGDYSLEGFEDILTIERKGSVSEWAQNVTQKRFKNELLRLDKIKYPWIMLEFTVTDVLRYPVGSGLPKNRMRYIKLRGPAILRMTVEMMFQHRARIIFCGDNGREITSSIFKRMIEHADRIKA